MIKASWFKFEKAVEFLIAEFNKVESCKKPTIFHSIRVGSILFHYWLSENICIAGLFHDILEDTKITFEILEKKYWKEITKIVLLNTKDNTLSNELFKIEMIKTCAEYSEEALIVKTADIYDNFVYYMRENNSEQLERCKVFANLIRKYRKENYNHEIFTLLDKILN